MDWGKAKTVLILSFLFLNILLGYQLWATGWGKSETNTAYVIQETNELLASKNIQLNVEEVPSDSPLLRSFTVRYDEPSMNASKLSLDTPIPMGNPFNKNFSRDLMAQTPVRHADHYEIDLIRSGNGVYVFNQMVERIPLFDSNLKLYEENDQIVAYKQTYVEVQSGGEQQEQRVISAHTAIRRLAENYLSEGSVIIDVKLGYHGTSFDSETQYMLPFWRIMLSDGSPYYVQAYNGEVDEPREPIQLPEDSLDG